MICQACGIEAPTKYVSLYQNIGVVVVRFTKTMQGRMCKNCIHKNYWAMTGTTFALGWWGYISFVLTPFILLNNTIRYAICLPMPPVPYGAKPPVLDEASVEKIKPFIQQLFDSLNHGEDLGSVATKIAELSDTSPAQVILFVRAVVQAQERK